eukprot:5604838-Pyramimonas_sp.AAC.1
MRILRIKMRVIRMMRMRMRIRIRMRIMRIRMRILRIRMRIRRGWASIKLRCQTKEKELGTTFSTGRVALADVERGRATAVPS